MIVHNLNIIRIAVPPDVTDAPLIVDANPAASPSAVSVAREPGADAFWIKSIFHGLDEIRPDFGLMRIDLSGKVLGGDYPVHGEWSLIAEISRARPEAGGIVHTHAPFVCMSSSPRR